MKTIKKLVVALAMIHKNLYGPQEIDQHPTRLFC